MRLPNFTLDAIRLTEVAAEQRYEKLKLEYEQAVDQKNQELADELHKQLEQIKTLNAAIYKATKERDTLEVSLRDAIIGGRSKVGTNAILLPTGLILLIKSNTGYGAVQAIEQSGQDRGSFIRYAWWYQDDGTGSFINANVKSGFAMGSENTPLRQVRLGVGPLLLEWSMSSEGSGHVYFGPGAGYALYELAITNEINISSIDATDTKYNFIKQPLMER